MNRIDEAMVSWQERQNRYIQRYGPDVVKDRGFIKVKLKALKRTLRETRGLKLNDEEKDDRNILKSRVRDFEKIVTPNPNIRFIKKVAEMSNNAIVIAWGIGVAIRKKIQDRKKDSSDSLSILTTIEPDYNGVGQQRNGTAQQENQQQQVEGQRNHARSTPLPDSTSQNQNNASKQPQQNRIEARRINKQRFISPNPGKGFRVK